jgi:membrane protein implicated in regulation of membrane protease activity
VTSLFIGCFWFGLLFASASLLLGLFGGQDLHVHGLHLHGHGAAHGAHNGNAHISPFNASTLAAFLTWFGGAGYLLTRYSGLTAVGITAVASIAGLVGAGILFAGLARVIVPRLTVMRQEDFEREGIVARVTSTIQPGGTGEIVYTLGGTRHSDGARSETAELLERGTEVVILRMDKGIAYVDRWSKFAEANQLPPGEAGSS